MDKTTLEGVIMELDAALDSLERGDVDFESFAARIEYMRDRLKKLKAIAPGYTRLSVYELEQLDP